MSIAHCPHEETLHPLAIQNAPSEDLSDCANAQADRVHMSECTFSDDVANLFSGAFSYQNHPIYKVDVIGVVVRVTENSKCFIYAGTCVSFLL